LFVALSVNSGALAASRSLRARATQTLVLSMTLVLVAVLLVAPQPAAALGAELLAVAVVSGTSCYRVGLAPALATPLNGRCFGARG
jgi:hypothetical protein